MNASHKTIFLVLLAFFLFISITSDQAGAVRTNQDTRLSAQVMDISHTAEEGSDVQEITVKVLEGEWTNHVIVISYSPIGHYIRDFDLKKGHRVIVRINMDENNKLSAHIVNISRTYYLKQLGMIFLVAVIIFGRIKGLLSVASLGVTGLIIIKILIPMILSGKNPIFSSVLCAVFIIIISFILISGLTRKSITAIIATIGGAVIAGLLSEYFVRMTSITGATDEEVIFLITELGINVDFRGLFMSGILIGTIGVVMDVSMSITSFVFELKEQSPHIKYFELISSGINVGKDVMATMINTLVLAYAGTSFPLFIAFVSIQTSLTDALNTEMVSGEIIRSLCGSIGLILTIPLTALIAGCMAVKPTNRRYRKKS